MEFETIAVDKIDNENGMFVNHVSSSHDQPVYCVGKVLKLINTNGVLLFITSKINKPRHIQITLWNIIQCLKYKNLFFPRIFNLPDYVGLCSMLYDFLASNGFI